MTPSNPANIVVSSASIEEEVLKSIPQALVNKYAVIPIEITEDGVITVATSTPEDIDIKDALESRLNRKVKFVYAESTDIQMGIELHYGSQSFTDMVAELSQPLEAVKKSKPVRKIKQGGLTELKHVSINELFDVILNYAIMYQASDIHIEPTADLSMIRFRIDGVLQLFKDLPANLHQNLISLIKVQAEMDITETRVPQDGQIEMQWNADFYDARIATSPTIYGEKVSIRLLKKASIGLGLEKLGFSKSALELIRSMIQFPSGLILLCGPTGSGKTTSLFSMLSEIRDISKNIVTIEDPVEYRLPLVNQMELKESAGLDFAKAARSLLRQDPDVILMGEIRDYESARMAVQSALAGTLLLSTLHSSSAILTIDRLINMGVDRYWVATTLMGVIAQRLVRRVCDYCKTTYSPDPIHLKYLGLPSTGKYYHGKGCPNCRQTGYHGRVCISEILMLNDDIKQGIYDHKTPIDLRKIAVTHSQFQPFLIDVKEKIGQGLTTTDEIFRVISPQML